MFQQFANISINLRLDSCYLIARFSKTNVFDCALKCSVYSDCYLLQIDTNWCKLYQKLAMNFVETNQNSNIYIQNGSQ